MPESKANNGWGLYSIRKLIEYGGIFLAVWQFGLPALNVYVEERIKAYEDEHNSSKSFRTLLSEEMGIPADRIHIYIGEWAKQHEQSEGLLDEMFPILEAEVNNIRPRLEILPGGRAKWYHTDGESYDASIGQDGLFWFYLKGIWYPCHT